MYRLLTVAIAAFALWMLFGRGASEPQYDANVCAGPPLKSIEERDRAQEAGYAINPHYKCIDKQSFAAVEAQKREWEQARAAKLAEEREAAAKAARSFAEQRAEFKTSVSVASLQSLPVPRPPENVFVRSDYVNAMRLTLPAFVTPDPKDGKKHAAIIWITGGDSNALSDFWTAGPEGNDQSARAFRDAGLVMAFPTLRGGHDGTGNREYFYGEVDDVLAMAKHVATLPYVDPDRIYLGGHSTGGTLALLTATTVHPFKAVFAFGPVARVDSYPKELVPLDFGRSRSEERKLRSPVYWLKDIAQPTYLIEGAAGQNNLSELEALCSAPHSEKLQCLKIEGADHFSVLAKMTQVIATQLAANDAVTLVLNQEDLNRGE